MDYSYNGRIIAQTTALRNEAIKYNYRRTIVKRGKENNNQTDIERLFCKIDPAYNEGVSELRQLMSLMEILWKSASTNTAFKMARSDQYRPGNDVSIELMIKTIERLAGSEVIKEEMVKILEQGKLLPKYPVQVENFHFDEFELTSTEGKTIYYNLYTACRHNAIDGDEPCEDCSINSMKQRYYMMNMVKRLYCE